MHDPSGELQRGAATRGEGGKQERAEGLEERCSTFSPAEEQGLERNGKKTPAVGQSAPEVFEQTAQCGSNQIADSHGELDRCPCQRVPAVSPPEGVSWPHVGAELPKKSSASDRGFESFRARRRRLSPWLRKGFFAGATLALLWACGPSLLNSLFSLLVAYEPSSQRIFTVACLKNRTKEGDTQGDGSHFQEVEKSSPTIDRGGLFDGDSACAVLLHPSRYYWGARPPFASLVVFLQSAALCSLEVVCALGLEPLLPEREAVERRLRRLGPILASLSLLLRPSSSPLQLPCEEWLSAWSDTNRRGDLHTWTRRKYAKKHQHSATAPFFDFIVVGGGTAGTTLAGLLGRLKQPQFQLDEQAAGRNGAPDVETEQTRGNSGRKKPRVLLLEAGGWPDLRAFSSLKIPARTFEGQRGDIDWKLSTTQQASACLVAVCTPSALLFSLFFCSQQYTQGLQESKSFWPRGKALGGSSWLNYMLFVRGDPRDYDSYSKCTKDERWAFSNVLRKFKQIERVQFPADPQFRGTGGSISVNLPETADPTVLAFLRSAEGLSLEAEEEGQAGSSTGSSYYAANPDYNGARYAGPSLFQLNTQNGKRRSPLEAFLLSPMLTDMDTEHQDDAPSVSVVFNARVIKIIFEPEMSQVSNEAEEERHRPPQYQAQANGQSAEEMGTGKKSERLMATAMLVVDETHCTAEKWEKEMCEVFEVPVKGELILTAGTIHTPQILLQSGVGDPAELKKLRLEPVLNIPGVGKNLQQDHVFTPRTFVLKDEVNLEEFASTFPTVRSGEDDFAQTEGDTHVKRLEKYAALYGSGVSLDINAEGGWQPFSSTEAGDSQEATHVQRTSISIKTANELRGTQLGTIWRYLTKQTGLLASSGVEAHVVSEHFSSLEDEENENTGLPSSCPPGIPLPDIQLHFLNAMPDAAFMKTRLNVPDWFPFIVGTPEDWGNAYHAPKLHGIVMMPVLLHPRSRGTVSLAPTSIPPTWFLDEKSQKDAEGTVFANPISSPQIDPQYLSNRRDVAALVKGLGMVKAIASSRPFASLIKKEMVPQCHPEVFRRIFVPNDFTGDAYVGVDKRAPQGGAVGDNNRPKEGLEGSPFNESSCDSVDCAEGILSSLSAKIAAKYPELAAVDPVLPRVCALAVAHEQGRISDEEWAMGFVRLFTLTLYHPVGTCKMGVADEAFLKTMGRETGEGAVQGAEQTGVGAAAKGGSSSDHTDALDEKIPKNTQTNERLAEKREDEVSLPPAWSATAVVDGSLRLCGGFCVGNVSIADASVLPHLPSGNTHLPVVLVAHVAAEALSERWLQG
ncbi:GMC oxidoreductase [Cyclospora cayetanensis]|uniref:GMC oxidoreductase n=1 Tax=Cyclospora cayetanensis TaxID=88456 RepID=A0A1D3D5Q8_9EIME|nr:GMC oxidoreductase [Cyclospora cayetanensis]